MTARFFADQPIRSPQVHLSGPEAHHLLHVMRATVGQEVVLFDGLGAEYRARIEKLQRDHVLRAVLDRQEIDRELSGEVVLGVALPKGDRQRWVVEKCVELGVSRLVPLITSRGVAQPTGSALQLVARQVVEASKQCGRNRLMSVAPPMEVEPWLASRPPGTAGLLADPTGQPPEGLLPFPVPAWLAVGPEGGWTDAELQAGRRSDWQVLALGPRILRVETAAVVLAAWCTPAAGPRR
jgi:16S rRNA (uracil1498-N3)-methyltransferase